jgi:hypothetical protein
MIGFVSYDQCTSKGPLPMTIHSLQRGCAIFILAGVALLGTACSSQRTSSPTTRPRKTTTTIPVTTTTATSIGGYIGTTTCPSLPVEADGFTGIQEGGVNVFYTVSGTPQQVRSLCTTQLEQAGWKVMASPTGSTSSVVSSLIATTNGAYGVINIGGSGQTASVAICTWNAKPTDATCSLGG